jgi:hypothetical protein
MEGINFKIINSKELLEMFDSLVPSLQQNIVKRGLTDAGRIILNQAKSNFNSVKKGKSRTGYKEITQGFKVAYLKNGVIGVRIGNSYYKSLWIEAGTKERFYKKGVKKSQLKNLKSMDGTHRTGVMVRTNFFRDAVDARKDEAQSKVSESIINQLDKVVKKHGL